MWLRLLTGIVLVQHLFASSGMRVVAAEKAGSDTDLFWQSVDEETDTPSLYNSFRLAGVESTKERAAQQRQPASHGRMLRRNRKEHLADFHWPAKATQEERHRLVIHCQKDQSQDDCLSAILSTPSIHGRNDNNIKVIQNLATIHAISIEVDTQTRDDLFTDNFELHRDFERKPLVVEGSMGYPPTRDRSLQEESTEQEYTWGMEMIRARKVWDEFGVRGEGVRVCVLDTGVDSTHEDFRGTVLDGHYGDESESPWYEDPRGHGTHCTGTIAATDNDVGIVGISPDVDIFMVKVFNEDKEFFGFADGTVYSTDLIAAAEICKEAGADIISASLGGENYNELEAEFFKELYEREGILTVAAAGNSGDDQNYYPGGYDEVFSVGAVDKSGVLADFSSLNPSTTDILAPGVKILSTYTENSYRSFSGTSMAAPYATGARYPSARSENIEHDTGNSYRSFSGTSMAAPYATGAVALMLSYIKKFNPGAKSSDVFEILRATAVSTDETTGNREGDFDHLGVIDAYSAVELLSNYGVSNRLAASYNSNYDSHCTSEVRLDLV
eukprot:CAMPEP_0178768380 /NCGR_PEP_ID=MMETSP0744-20121128/20207_1 /TAXON_ID=913974 /ORGANISM="Nitzschia punctata, Strain CCMP561" /LENGTH=555 /DNA_ID=CAMNT_0020424445 /DNA_START=225 /DNA_END=1889 /DNA_ORIENTATION=-